MLLFICATNLSRVVPCLGHLERELLDYKGQRLKVKARVECLAAHFCNDRAARFFGLLVLLIYIYILCPHGVFVDTTLSRAATCPQCVCIFFFFNIYFTPCYQGIQCTKMGQKERKNKQ